MKEYRTINQIAGPLIFVEKTDPVGYGELVDVALSNGEKRKGQVLDTAKDIVIVQIFGETIGIDKTARVRFTGETIKLKVSSDMLGRVFSGLGNPIDGGPEVIPEDVVDIS